MSSHCNVWSNAPSKIHKHTNYSTIFPIILSWNSLKILVQERLPDWGELLICYTVFDSKKGCYSLDQERLHKFKCVSINLLDTHSKLYIDCPFILQHKVFISSVKQLNQCINSLHGVTNNDAIVHLCEYNASLTKENTRINTDWNNTTIYKTIAQFCKPIVTCLLQTVKTLV